MAESLQTFGSHYEIWRLDDGSLCINVTHTNKTELRHQQNDTPRQWWNRYSHQTPWHSTMAIRHAGNLVRAYPAEFQADQVRFCFVSRGQPGCADETWPETKRQLSEGVRTGRLKPIRNGGGTHPGLDAGQHAADEAAFQRWLQVHFAASAQRAIPLFKADGLTVRVRPERVPVRHPEMTRFYGDLIAKVRDGSEYCGIIYCMYWLRDGQIVPVYIGKAERYGKNGGISANLASGPFGRWGYSRYYHMGDLGAGLRGEDTYRDWVEKLFEDPKALRLRAPVFFSATAWTHADRCPCGESVNVVALENCLIRHKWAFSAGDNLNKARGQNRCHCP
jgi:hypothetical protein